jgi:hypothetical protein
MTLADFMLLGKSSATGAWCKFPRDVLPLFGSGMKPQRCTKTAKFDEERGAVSTSEHTPCGDPLDFWAYAALALINAPRVIGRKQHMPHERIEREQLKQLGLVGKFPLRAWTEIVLTVAPADNRTGEPSTEAHLTGEKCLHYCRTHLRVRLGTLEYVEGHWRGNPALGMKRNRYRLEKEKQP